MIRAIVGELHFNDRVEGLGVHEGEEVAERATPGVYTITYKSFQRGEHTLVFHISAIGDRKLDPEITLEATRTISGDLHKHGSDMKGSTSTITYVIIGAAAMAAMMFAMLVVSGRMF